VAVPSPCAALRHTAKTNIRRVLCLGTRRILTASYGSQRPLAAAHVEPTSPCVVEWAHGEVVFRRVFLFRRVILVLRTANMIFTVCPRNCTLRNFWHTANSWLSVVEQQLQRGNDCVSCLSDADLSCSERTGPHIAFGITKRGTVRDPQCLPGRSICRPVRVISSSDLTGGPPPGRRASADSDPFLSLDDVRSTPSSSGRPLIDGTSLSTRASARTNIINIEIRFIANDYNYLSHPLFHLLNTDILKYIFIII